MLFTYAVDNCADGVGDTAREHKSESHGAHSRNGGGEVDGDAPAHTDVEYHRNLAELFHIYGGKRYCGDEERPYENKDCPGRFGFGVINSDQCRRCISSRNEEIDRTMVDNLHYSLAHAGRE